MWYAIGTACIISHPARAVKVQKKRCRYFPAPVLAYGRGLGAPCKSEPTAAYPLHAAAAFDHADCSQYQHAADRQIEQAHGERALLAHGARRSAYCLRCFAVDRSSRFRIRCLARFPADCSARRRILCRCFRMPRRVRRRDPGRTASPCCTARAVPVPGVAATPVRRRRESAGRRECPRRTRCRRVPWCLIRTNYS